MSVTGGSNTRKKWPISYTLCKNMYMGLQLQKTNRKNLKPNNSTFFWDKNLTALPHLALKLTLASASRVLELQEYTNHRPLLPLNISDSIKTPSVMANKIVKQHWVSKHTLDFLWNKHTHCFLPIPHHFSVLLSKQMSTALWNLKKDA